MRNQTEVKSRDQALDFVKAISILLVLFLHLKPIWFDFQPSDTSRLALYCQRIINLIRLYLCTLAVPLFYISSLYILVQKFQTDIPYLRKRISRLMHLFFFWISIQCVIYFLIHSINMFLFNVSFPLIINSPVDFIICIYKGGPDLPVAGGSVFYFISNLIVLVILLFVFQQIKCQNLKYLLSFLIIAGSAVFFEYQQLYMDQIISYWNILNFIPYVPIAWLLTRIRDKYYTLVISLSIIFFLFDIFKKYYFDVPLSLSYSRGFVLAGSYALFFFLYKNYIKWKGFSMLSIYSLGIFAVHKYWQLCIMFTLNALNIGPIMLSGGFRIDYFIVSILCTLLSVMSVYYMRQSPLKYYVS